MEIMCVLLIFICQRMTCLLQIDSWLLAGTIITVFNLMILPVVLMLLYPVRCFRKCLGKLCCLGHWWTTLVSRTHSCSDQLSISWSSVRVQRKTANLYHWQCRNIRPQGANTRPLSKERSLLRKLCVYCLSLFVSDDMFTSNRFMATSWYNYCCSQSHDTPSSFDVALPSEMFPQVPWEALLSRTLVDSLSFKNSFPL